MKNLNDYSLELAELKEKMLAEINGFIEGNGFMLPIDLAETDDNFTLMDGNVADMISSDSLETSNEDGVTFDVEYDELPVEDLSEVINVLNNAIVDWEN